MINAENRAARQASRFPGLDLYAIQRQVHRNLSRLQLRLNGKYMGLLDLMNYLKNNRHSPELTPDNADQHYTLANMVTLNGIYLYQYLLREGYDPIIIQNYSLAKLSEVLYERPLAVCISSNFLYLDDIQEIACQIKEYDPQIPVIAGGMLVKKVLDAGQNLAPQTLKWLSTFQGKVDVFIVEAQGEQTLIKSLETMKNGGDLRKVPNLALFDERGKMRFTPRVKEGHHMDSTVITWDKIPRMYLRKTLPVNTSRGCVYRCRFCSYHRLFPQVHYKSLEVLREELRLIQGLGFVSHIRFTDDNFTANKNRLKSVLKMMIKEKFDFTWSSYARASALDPELVKLMKTSGCEFLDMGIESGSQTILNNMDKRLEREQAIHAIGMLNDHGIYSEGGFIVGYPGETPETFSETVDLINTSGLPYYHPFLFYYSKDMLVHRESSKFELEGLGRAWRHKTMDAVMASDLMSQMIRRIDRGFTDGQTGNWEAFKLLRGEGYLPDEIFELFRLKRELHLGIGELDPGEEFSGKMERILIDMEQKLR
jgi:p-methyltransferase